MFSELVEESYKNPALDELKEVEKVHLDTIHYDVGKNFFEVNKNEMLAGFSMSEIRSLDSVYDLIHPADVEKVFSWTNKAIQFLSFNGVDCCGVTSQLMFRMIGKDRKIYKVNRYSIINRLDSMGNMATNASRFFDVSWMKPTNYGAGILDGPGTESFHNDLPELTTFRSVLSVREIEILRLIAKGFNSDIISEALHISKHTVNTHRKNMLNKMEAANTPELLYLAKEFGLI